MQSEHTTSQLPESDPSKQRQRLHTSSANKQTARTHLAVQQQQAVGMLVFTNSPFCVPTTGSWIASVHQLTFLCASNRQLECLCSPTYLFVCQQQAVGMLMFRGQFIVRQQVCKLLHKAHHLLMPRHIGHSQARRFGLSAVGHSLETINFFSVLCQTGGLRLNTVCHTLQN